MKVGIIIVTYNRPEYFKECLDSFTVAAIPFNSVVILIDDCSTNEKTVEYFNSFSLADITLLKVRNTTNKGITTNLKLGFELCFSQGCDIVMNFDSDAIVKKNAINKLIELKQKFPNNIVTGFNCITKNLNGTERHKIEYEGDGYNVKKSVGGINFVVEQQQYEDYVLPALKIKGNWDHNASIASQKEQNGIVCCVPSVVQHIGLNSSLGHSTDEPPDIADDFDEKVDLKDVTLIGIDCKDLNRLINARNECIKNIKFGAVVLLSSITSSEAIKIHPINSKEAYSEFIMKHLYKYVQTKYALIFQHDGYVVNANAWREEFFNCDYIGATWWYKDSLNVGNGGFSLRSKRLLEITATDSNITQFHPEDDKICRTYRKYLEENHKIIFATEDLANRFAIESYNSPDNNYSGQFGVHGTNVKGTSLYKEPIIQRQLTGREQIFQSRRLL